MKKVGLLMGSFNPVHIGHMGIANYMLEFTDIDAIDFIVSPQNPFKQNQSLLDENERLKMVQIAIGVTENMYVSDIEFTMEKPSYSIDTLKTLQAQNTDIKYVLIIGSDNLELIEQWRDYEYILENFDVYVYERIGYSTKTIKMIHLIQKYNINVFNDCPSIELSSTFIRKALSENKCMKYFLPIGVQYYINQNNYYK